MDIHISKSAFKARALGIFRDVERKGGRVIITDHGKPTLEIRPFQEPTLNPMTILKGSVLHYDNPTNPVGENEWDALK